MGRHSRRKKKSRKNIIYIAIVVGITLGYIGLRNQRKITNSAPVVISTNPVNNAAVSSNRTFISVTFNRTMQKGCSWGYERKDAFPKVNGKPIFSPDHKTCTLPVELEPNKTYEILINPGRYKNFKDKDGNSAMPYKFKFSTAS